MLHLFQMKHPTAPPPRQAKTTSPLNAPSNRSGAEVSSVGALAAPVEQNTRRQTPKDI